MAATWTTSTVASAFEARYAAVKLRLEAFMYKENPKFTGLTSIQTDDNWTSGTGWQAASSSTFAHGEAWKAFNKTNTDGYDGWVGDGNAVTTTDPEWVRIKYPEPVVVKKYSITSRNELPGVIFPTKWRLEGTNNITGEWVPLETYREEASWEVNTTKDFTVGINETGTAYLYYRLYIIDAQTSNTNTANKYVAIGDWVLFTKI
jgi:hypothetical protein